MTYPDTPQTNTPESNPVPVILEHDQENPLQEMTEVDIAVIGSGPAGQSAALHAAFSGKRVALIERAKYFGGTSEVFGSIASRRLYQNVLQKVTSASLIPACLAARPGETEMRALINMEEVLESEHERVLQRLTHTNLLRIHGHARFKDNNTLSISRIQQPPLTLKAQQIILACGAHAVDQNPKNHIVKDQPSTNENRWVIDHEHCFDHESFLSILYLPKKLVIVGNNIKACETASVLQTLGVSVTLISHSLAPMPDQSKELQDQFLSHFLSQNGYWIPENQVTRIYWESVGNTFCELSDGTLIETEKVFIFEQTIPNTQALNVEDTDLKMDDNNTVRLATTYQTQVDNIYAIGRLTDINCSPEEASVQGREVIDTILQASTLPLSKQQQGKPNHWIPTRFYGFPEMAYVGEIAPYVLPQRPTTHIEESYDDALLDAPQINNSQVNNSIVIGRSQLYRTLEQQAVWNNMGIMSATGTLSLFADTETDAIIGAFIIGTGACELIEIARMALTHHYTLEDFIHSPMSSSTDTYAYTAAALNILQQKGC
ncbi:FAD-dependent oxidoreductase [Marinibactrum halimedae]|uniref:Soluble pyridine nucleotide transhydrogenase n=1 Tax=Marinibactrum halimedae TaxID=1444977 RepID=A0AA37WKS4_9GAMM|nr:FAD-dependent oxidoreductase [Marinibactrum halimedae]MCD9459896.1 FAD-dependent oxidoreductase [Marinibactrum halimedae]GLS25248.1 soluble pyridine nucleotide transhydrogenase [Marinibactrum halimedae]